MIALGYPVLQRDVSAIVTDSMAFGASNVLHFSVTNAITVQIY